MNACMVTIRSANSEDIVGLPAVERDAAQRYLDVGYDFCATGPVRDLEEHHRGLERGALLVAEAPPDGVVGFALAWEVDAGGHLVELSVKRSHQRMGVGRRLIAVIEAWAAEQGFREVTLTTFRGVPWNAPVYERLGYHAFEPGPDRQALRTLQVEERAAGFEQRPRVAMCKRLD